MSEELVKSIYKVEDDKISGFFKEHRNLSNFGEGKVDYEGLVYLNREAAFQSAKTINMEAREAFTTMNPSEAKKQGRLLLLRQEWDQKRDEVMYDICKSCFSNNDFLKELLLSTGDKYLEETNWWGDTYWGVCRGIGQNQLGKTLMRIRSEFQQAKT